MLAVLAAAIGVAGCSSAAAPKARQYLNVSACLLTDPGGVVAGTAGAPVWAAMESASRASRVMVSYLSDTGPGDVTPMLNTLVERRCGVIITTGAAAGTVIAAAKADPHQHFLMVLPAGGLLPRTPSNAVAVSSAAAAAHVGQAVRALAAQA